MDTDWHFFFRAKRSWFGCLFNVVEGLSQTLSDELEKTNIKVNSLDPGRMRTEMRRAAYPAENSDKNPLPEDKSSAIVYLMSEKTKKLNGEQLTLSDA
jgi:NAD(P)-dependent dehydrogenase (short-subunit alcohol dehydrogenase family)